MNVSSTWWTQTFNGLFLCEVKLNTGRTIWMPEVVSNSMFAFLKTHKAPPTWKTSLVLTVIGVMIILQYHKIDKIALNCLSSLSQGHHILSNIDQCQMLSELRTMLRNNESYRKLSLSAPHYTLLPKMFSYWLFNKLDLLFYNLFYHLLHCREPCPYGSVQEHRVYKQIFSLPNGLYGPRLHHVWPFQAGRVSKNALYEFNSPPSPMYLSNDLESPICFQLPYFINIPKYMDL